MNKQEYNLHGYMAFTRFWRARYRFSEPPGNEEFPSIDLFANSVALSDVIPAQ